MSVSRVLVLGSYGMLGHKLIEHLNNDFEVFGTCRRKLGHYIDDTLKSRLIEGVNAEDVSTVENVIREYRPQVVLNAIGVVKQLAAGKSPLPNIQINALFPHQLARVAEPLGAKVFQFSTDCVFSGKKGAYLETDISDAEDVYGRSKFLGELNDNHSLTIRSSIIGPQLDTAYSLIFWFIAQKGKEVGGFKRAMYSGFPTLEMANIVRMLIQKQPEMTGVWQISSPAISKFDLLELVNKKMNLGIKINPNDTFFCDRSLNGKRFEETTGYKSPEWPQLVENMVNDMMEHAKAYRL